MIRAGALRARVVLEAPARTADAGGGAAIVWTAESGLWATIAPRRGQEGLRANGLFSRVTHEVTIRHRDGVTPEKRFRLGTRVFAIRAVRDDGRGRQLICDCEEETVA